MELHRALAGARLKDVRLQDPETVLFAFDGADGEARVLVCVRPRHSRIHLTQQDWPDRGKGVRHPFLDASRVFLGSCVTRVRVRFGDRVLGMEFARPRGSPPGAEVEAPSRRRRIAPPSEETCGLLLFECTGHHPNLFWTDPLEIIRASLVPSRSHRRDLRPGRRYQPPIPHPSERMDSLRFLPSGDTTVSHLIEEYYARLWRDEIRRAEEARIVRDLQRTIARLERLRDGLRRDLQEQERAAHLLEGDEFLPSERERLIRLANRQTSTRERLERIQRRLNRLTQQAAEARLKPDR